MTVNSSLDDLALSNMNSYMESVVQHRDPGDCDAGGAVLVEQGLMTLNKVTS